MNKTKNKTSKCFKCTNEIDINNDRYVSLITYDEGDIIEQINFHINCWGDYNQDRVNKRLVEMTNIGFKKLKEIGVEL